MTQQRQTKESEIVESVQKICVCWLYSNSICEYIYPQKRNTTASAETFPRNFIFSLTKPTNYIGPEKYFGLNDDDDMDDPPLPLTKTVRDAEIIFPPKHKKDLHVSQLPYSLKYAVKQYLLACTARMLRETSNVHNSMLVHVTRYTAVQNSVL